MPRVSRGIGLKLVATLAFALMNVLIKSLSHLSSRRTAGAQPCRTRPAASA